MNDHPDRAAFTRMDEGTQADWQVIGSHFFPFAQQLPDRVLAHLKLLDGDYGGFPVDRLQHSLQTATRAHRAGESEDYVVMALLHDIGDTLGSYNHPDIAAAILKPFVDEKLHWICEKHGIFQGYYFFHYIGLDRDMREAFRGHPHFEDRRDRSALCLGRVIGLVVGRCAAGGQGQSGSNRRDAHQQVH